MNDAQKHESHWRDDRSSGDVQGLALGAVPVHNGAPPRKIYTKPRMITERLFETKALACGKLPTGDASDCHNHSGGMIPNSTS
ncbi:MAG: hypothetical protein HUU29_10360 [Planctomycetaceae bacterium]|nr:hypothetical protein [Planctomycetaceae bacterium]